MHTKNAKYVPHSLYVLKTHQNHSKMLNNFEFIMCSYKYKYKYTYIYINPHSLYLLEAFGSHPKMFVIFEFIR